MSKLQVRWKMARQIALKFEARYKNGLIAVYELPAEDGGGRYEVAGINEKYNKPEADHLVELIRQGKHKEAEDFATGFIAKKTDKADTYTKFDGVEFFIRDCIFNRGATGAIRIMQMSLSVKADGIWGPVSKSAFQSAERDIDSLYVALRKGREKYERLVKKRDEQHKFWPGLVNRWDKAIAFARTL